MKIFVTRIVLFIFLILVGVLVVQAAEKKDDIGIWAINTKLRDCKAIMASSYEAFHMAYNAMVANNDRLLSKLINDKAIAQLSGDGKYVIVLETKKISFGNLARLDNKSDVDEIWVDLRCLARKGSK
jgi:hypothetical protein